MAFMCVVSVGSVGRSRFDPQTVRIVELLLTSVATLLHTLGCGSFAYLSGGMFSAGK